MVQIVIGFLLDKILYPVLKIIGVKSIEEVTKRVVCDTKKISNTRGKVSSVVRNEKDNSLYDCIGTIENYSKHAVYRVFISVHDLYWDKRRLEIKDEKKWSTQFYEKGNPGCPFTVHLVALTKAGNAELEKMYAEFDRNGCYPGIRTIDGALILDQMEIDS